MIYINTDHEIVINVCVVIGKFDFLFFIFFIFAKFDSWHFVFLREIVFFFFFHLFFDFVFFAIFFELMSQCVSLVMKNCLKRARYMAGFLLSFEVWMQWTWFVLFFVAQRVVIGNTLVLFVWLVWFLFVIMYLCNVYNLYGSDSNCCND